MVVQFVAVTAKHRQTKNGSADKVRIVGLPAIVPHVGDGTGINWLFFFPFGCMEFWFKK